MSQIVQPRMAASAPSVAHLDEREPAGAVIVRTMTTVSTGPISFRASPNDSIGAEREIAAPTNNLRPYPLLPVESEPPCTFTRATVYPSLAASTARRSIIAPARSVYRTGRGGLTCAEQAGNHEAQGYGRKSVSIGVIAMGVAAHADGRHMGFMQAHESWLRPSSGIFDALAPDPLSAADVAGRCDTSPAATEKLLNALVGSGYLSVRCLGMRLVCRRAN